MHTGFNGGLRAKNGRGQRNNDLQGSPWESVAVVRYRKTSKFLEFVDILVCRKHPTDMVLGSLGRLLSWRNGLANVSVAYMMGSFPRGTEGQQALYNYTIECSYRYSLLPTSSIILDLQSESTFFIFLDVGCKYIYDVDEAPRFGWPP